MTTESTGSEAVISQDASTGDTDAQLNAMRESEQETAQTHTEESEVAEKTVIKEEKVVPLAALHEERRERQRLTRELQERDRQREGEMAKLNQRLEALMNPQRQAPNKDEDVVGYLDHRIGEVHQTQQQILQQNQHRDQQEQQQRVIRNLTDRVIGNEQAFAKATPDYVEAIQHLDKVRVQELMVYGHSEEQAWNQAVNERQQAALHWANQGLPAAETAYNLAKVRGFQGGKKAASAEEKVEAQQKGQSAARSLGGGSSTTAGRMTAEALLAMSDDDFAKVSQSDWKKAMGG